MNSLKAIIVDDDRLHAAIERAVAHHEQGESARSKERLMELMMGMTGASASSIEEMAQADGPRKAASLRLTYSASACWCNTSCVPALPETSILHSVQPTGICHGLVAG